MAHPRMDDTAYLTSLLTEWGAPATLQAALTAGGFTALATVAFAAEEGSDEAPVLRALLRNTDDPLPVNPAIANARRLIHFATAAAGRTPSPPVVASPASLLAGAAVPKLTAEVAEDLRAKFLSHYPGPRADAVPAAAPAGSAGRQRSPLSSLASALFTLLLPDDHTAGPSASISLSGPAEPTLRRMIMGPSVASRSCPEAR